MTTQEIRKLQETCPEVRRKALEANERNQRELALLRVNEDWRRAGYVARAAENAGLLAGIRGEW